MIKNETSEIKTTLYTHRLQVIYLLTIRLLL